MGIFIATAVTIYCVPAWSEIWTHYRRQPLSCAPNIRVELQRCLSVPRWYPKLVILTKLSLVSKPHQKATVSFVVNADGNEATILIQTKLHYMIKLLPKTYVSFFDAMQQNILLNISWPKLLFCQFYGNISSSKANFLSCLGHIKCYGY